MQAIDDDRDPMVWRPLTGGADEVVELIAPTLDGTQPVTEGFVRLTTIRLEHPS